MTKKFKKGYFNVDHALDSMDMEFTNYTPSLEALEFFAIIKVFYGEDFEVPNSKFHYFIVDMLFGNVDEKDFPYSDEINAEIPINPSRIGVIAARGSAKSTITTTFYPIYCAIKGETPLIKNISHMLILSDSQQGGARDQAKLLAGEFEKSVFAKEYFEKMRFTESEAELIRSGSGPIEKRHILIKFKGAMALSLDTQLFTDNGITTMGNVKVGDKLLGACGKLCTVTEKSEVFYKDMYEIVLKDGRSLKVSEDHINSILYRRNNYRNGSPYEHMNITTDELLKLPMWKENPKTGHKTPRIWIENIRPLEYTEKELEVDPYTLGLWLGDGYYHTKDYSAKLTAHKEDMKFYEKVIPYEFGYKDEQNNCVTTTIKGLGAKLRKLDLDGCKAPDKFVPETYKYGSIQQRIDIISGLIDSDGTVREGNKGAAFVSTSKQLADDVIALVRSIGGIAYHSKPYDIVSTGVYNRNHILYRVNIKCNLVLSKLPRKADKWSKKQRCKKVAITDIRKIETEPSQCIAIDSDLREYVAGSYIRTHNTGGIRSGSRNPITRDRYAIIIGDDVIKNEADAYSETIMKNVKTALFSDALNAMRGKNTQLVLINTPFRKADPIYTALESGVFTPLAAPICKKIYEDMPKEEFKGLWNAMHDYDAVMERYLNAVGNHTAREFNQELMLRVSSEEDKLVQDDQIQWYDRSVIKKNLDYYNLYATTDYTASNDLKGDFSCTMLWAVSSNNDWFMLDLSVKKQTITDQYKPLFKMINQWGSKNSRHVYVGVEIDGQQQLNLHTLKKMMLEHNTFFSFARQIGASITQEGIRRKGKGNKHEHFMRVHPLFQEHKVYLPEDLKNTPDMKELLEELNYVTYSGIAAKHDDALDCVSMIASLDVLLPSSESNKELLKEYSESDIWEMDFEDDEFRGNKSTIF